jgi:transposase
MNDDTKKRTRRRHSAELKAKILVECARPGASVAAVALAHGINANVVHKWRRLAAGDAMPAPAAAFVSIPLPVPMAGPAADIRVEIRHGATSMAVTWPIAAAAECATWMRELLR